MCLSSFHQYRHTEIIKLHSLNFKTILCPDHGIRRDEVHNINCFKEENASGIQSFIVQILQGGPERPFEKS